MDARSLEALIILAEGCRFQGSLGAPQRAALRLFRSFRGLGFRVVVVVMLRFFFFFGGGVGLRPRTPDRTPKP